MVIETFGLGSEQPRVGHAREERSLEPGTLQPFTDHGGVERATLLVRDSADRVVHAADGVVSALASAPVVVYLFGGVTGSGSSFVVALFLKTGQQLLDSVVLAGLATDPIDKALEVLLAALLYRATPREFIAMLAPAQPSAA